MNDPHQRKRSTNAFCCFCPNVLHSVNMNLCYQAIIQIFKINQLEMFYIKKKHKTLFMTMRSFCVQKHSVTATLENNESTTQTLVGSGCTSVYLTTTQTALPPRIEGALTQLGGKLRNTDCSREKHTADTLGASAELLKTRVSILNV